MAKYTCVLTGNLNALLCKIEYEILNGSVSASYEDGCDWTVGDVQIAMRVYERYSFAGGNRVSLSLTLAAGQDGVIRLCARHGGRQSGSILESQYLWRGSVSRLSTGSSRSLQKRRKIVKTVGLRQGVPLFYPHRHPPSRRAFTPAVFRFDPPQRTNNRFPRVRSRLYRKERPIYDRAAACRGRHSRIPRRSHQYDFFRIHSAFCRSRGKAHNSYFRPAPAPLPSSAPPYWRLF